VVKKSGILEKRKKQLIQIIKKTLPQNIPAIFVSKPCPLRSFPAACIKSQAIQTRTKNEKYPFRT
jgi:hypothetical protein